MAIKRVFLILSLLFMILGTGFAQVLPEDIDLQESTETQNAAGSDIELSDSEESAFRRSETDSGSLFMQRLTWEEARYAVRYQVVLERKRDTTGVYTEVIRRNLDASETFIDISVPAGEYRFKVYSFNVLGLLDSQSDWEYFTVIQALNPTVISFSPGAFYFDRLTPRIIVLTGDNLLPESDIYLESKTQINESGLPVVIRPSDILRNELGENARLFFKEEDLIAGKYEIVVINPGGLDTRAGLFTIAVAKPFDINVAGSFSPLFTLFGQKDYFLDRVFIPLGFSLRASFVPLKMPVGNLGAELSTTYARIKSNMNGYKTSAHLVAVHFDAMFQYWITRKELSVNGRAGLGFAGILNYIFTFNTGETWDPINTAALSFNLGASVQWMFYKQLFVEGGLDYIHVAHKEIPMGLLRIGIFGGYQF